MILKKLIKLTLAIITISIFTCCGKKEIVTKGIVGEFAITKIVYNQKSLLRNLGLNIIEFHSDGSLIIPTIDDRHHKGVIEDNNVNGSWKLVQVGEKFQIDIETKNIYFKNKFDLSFTKTEEGNVLINLKNDTLSLIAEKSLFDYRRNKSFIEDLIKYTN